MISFARSCCALILFVVTMLSIGGIGVEGTSGTARASSGERVTDDVRRNVNFDTETTPHLVWSFSWITAISTGLGALPLYFTKEMSSYRLHLSNAFAGGMMIAASLNLLEEGYERSAKGVVVGATIGLAFMKIAKRFLGDFEYRIEDIDGASVRRMILVIFVMTVHSFSEGIAIGVSFAGNGGFRLGTITAISLAVHNVPEGFAISLTLVPRGVSASTAALWSVFSSLPQPFMAVLAYMLVDHFIFLLPIGLGFAAGAMLWVATEELLRESLSELSLSAVCTTASTAALIMAIAQDALDSSP